MGCNMDSELLSLLGATLIAVQKVDNLLYRSIQPLCKYQPLEALNTLGRMTPELFLQGTTAELKQTLLLLNDNVGEALPLSMNQMSDFIYKRNLVTRQFWQITDAEVKGGEKMANPKQFLLNLLNECEQWGMQVESSQK
ncbi:hypothetical protein PL18_15650 [Vibrio renipiscarius]|uniref:Uncharacterized protein n=2 Tax=Vibrio renipiscarius TaxID=1461322 RepID=A0A0C2JKG8_9VIBR|nr:hypothetical protein PL18_15650 [Vibrio renipiscarius]KII78454.1 hypothetical protein OJ16_10285 [Vibrio renipiscarius]